MRIRYWTTMFISTVIIGVLSLGAIGQECSETAENDLQQEAPAMRDLGSVEELKIDHRDTKGSRTTESRDLMAAIDAYLQPYVESHNFSGTVLLARGGNILVNKGYGMAVYKDSVPNTAETKFQIASVSKSFTAAAILLLLERGQLQLEDSVSRFVPGFPKGSEITIQHLLTHTSGLPRYVFFSDYREKSQQPHTTADLVEWFQVKPLSFSPGERYGYSNSNYVMLAHIIEKVSGLSYGGFLKTNILDPLDLKDTGHRGKAHAIIDNLASGHVLVGLIELESSRSFDYSTDTGAGSLYSTVQDLFKWFRARQGAQLLKPATRDRMLEEVETPLGFGWHPEKRLDRDALVMRGWDGVGFAAQFVHYLTEDLTVVVLTNFSVSSITAEIADNLAAIGFGENYEPLQLLAKSKIDAPVLQDITGLYRFGSDFYVPGGTIRLIESDGRILIPGAQGGALLPVSGNTFIHRQHWFRITFERGTDGKVTGMRYGEFEAKKDTGL